MSGIGRRRVRLGTAALALAATVAGCTDDGGDGPNARPSSSARSDAPVAAVRTIEDCVSVLDADTPAGVALTVSAALFDSAPVVVVAPAEAGPELREGAEEARRRGAPLLLAADTGGAGAGADTADCAEAAPSPTPTATASPSESPDDEETASADETESPEPDESFERTESAEPTFTAAALAPATGTSCLSDIDDQITETATATPSPSEEPTDEPTGDPTGDPTGEPSDSPTDEPSDNPTDEPTPSGTPADTGLDQAVADEISRLDPEAVLAMTPEIADEVRAALPDLRVELVADDLPESATPEPMDLTVLVSDDSEDRVSATAVEATARAAGARVIATPGGDPRTDSCAIEALADAPPEHLLAAGDFGPAEQLADRLAVAVTGVELPGGGQVLFPGRRLVAMYGYPGAPELGVLGAQGTEASIDRVRTLAAQYDDISDVPVVPTFEIITTVAQGVPGSDGDYSAESSVDKVRPLVEAAGEAGMYAILDLQPGRTDFLTQARRYEELLKLPHVGLALDPEWRLKPGQVHLRQIGSVDASEINRVSEWLAELTAENRLPQKLLVLHQFSLTMITNRAALDTSHDELALLIHMDGQGEPIAKEGTWRIVTNTIPETIWLGWKNFYRKDTRLMSPTETLDRERQPVMISYQ